MLSLEKRFTVREKNVLFLLVFMIVVSALLLIPAVTSCLVTGAENLAGRNLDDAVWMRRIRQHSFSSMLVLGEVLFSFMYLTLSKKKSFSSLWVFLCLYSLAAVAISCFLFKRDDCSRLFWHDKSDIGMDYFNSVLFQTTFYPGLAKLSYKLIFLPFQDSLLEIIRFRSTVDSLQDMLAYKGMLRSHQDIFFIFIMVTLISCFAVSYLGTYFFEEGRSGLIKGFCIALSYSCLYAIERGNIVLQAFVFLLFYVLFYKSDNKVLRELSLLALAVSFGLKFYPAVFGMLLLVERRWKEAFRCALYALVLLVASEIIYSQINGWSEFVLSSLFGFMKILVANIFGRHLALMVAMGLFALAVCSLCIFVVVKTEKEWVRLFLVGLISVVAGIQFCYFYAWLMLVPAFLSFISEEREVTARNVIDFSFFMLINLTLPVFVTVKPVHLSLAGLSKTAVTILFAVYIVVAETKSILENKSKSVR